MTGIAQSTPGAFDHHRGRAPLLRQTSTLRGYVFVAASLAGFVAANAFQFYLSTGAWFDFSLGSYRRALGTPLTEMLCDPLNIFAHPWMIVVAGLLIAAIVFVPLMVAVLYRLWLSSVFVLTVAVVGHAPLLAIFLAGGCLLAAGTPLRSNQPFLAMLAGLSPVALYLFLMFFLFFESQEQVLFPRDWVVLMPFIVSLVASLAAAAIVLALARITRYRPGVIWPVLYFCLAVPALVFYYFVGPVEMDYALIAARIDAGAGDALFTAQTVEEFRQETAGADKDQGEPAAILAAATADLEQRRRKLLADCDRFLHRYRPNDRAPSVMWVRATTVDVRLDEEALRAGQVRYKYVGPSRRSIGAWLELSDLYYRSPQAMIAQQRLGIEALRDRRVQKAWEHFHNAQSLLIQHLSHRPARRPEGRLFARQESLPTAEYCRAALGEVGRIIWLMEVNGALEAGADTVEAFAQYMLLWPFRDAPAQELAELAKRFEQTELADNFRFQSAMAEKSDARRALALSRLTGQNNDAAIEANYELGRLAMRMGDKPDWSVMQLKTAPEYFNLVPAGTPYYPLAQQHLAWLSRGKEGAP